MDIIDIFQSLGLTNKETKNLLKQIFKTKEELEKSFSENRKQKTRNQIHQEEIKNYLKAFPQLDLTYNETKEETAQTLYAKITFLASIGIEINNQNKKYITLTEEEFYHIFKVTYQELETLYPYNLYQENIIKRR